jgi:hypothetical protein
MRRHSDEIERRVRYMLTELDITAAADRLVTTPAAQQVRHLTPSTAPASWASTNPRHRDRCGPGDAPGTVTAGLAKDDWRRQLVIPCTTSVAVPRPSSAPSRAGA